MFDPWVGGSPGGGHDNPLQYYCLGESPGQRSLAGHSPQGLTESDMTEATEHACNVEPIYFLHQYDGSNISTSLSSLHLILLAGIFCLFFYCSHSSTCEMVSQVGFDLHFLND